MISARVARQETEKNKCVILPKQKLLQGNENKEFYIPLPYKLKFIEMLIEDAISKGLNFRKIHNEITPEAEQCLIENGYKVKYYKHFLKVSW